MVEMKKKWIWISVILVCRKQNKNKKNFAVVNVFVGACSVNENSVCYFSLYLNIQTFVCFSLS